MKRLITRLGLIIGVLFTAGVVFLCGDLILGLIGIDIYCQKKKVK